MLNGKFKVKWNNIGLRNGDIITFLNGDGDIGEFCFIEIKNIEELKRYGLEVEPYKEYLTIEELVFEQGNQFKVNVDGVGKDFHVIVDCGELIVVDTGKSIGEFVLLEFIISAKFTPYNPNQKRIDELHKLIELENSYIDTANKCISGYEEELKELEG